MKLRLEHQHWYSFVTNVLSLKGIVGEFPVVVNNETCIWGYVAANGIGVGTDGWFVSFIQLCHGLLSK